MSLENPKSQSQVCVAAVVPDGSHFTKVRNDRADIKVSQEPGHTPSWKLWGGEIWFCLPRGHRPTFLCLSPIFTAGDTASS